MNEHVRRIQTKQTKVHYLSNEIQNEVISLVGDKISEEIARQVKKAKYFSVIMDCTPDISHAFYCLESGEMRAISWCIYF